MLLAGLGMCQENCPDMSAEPTTRKTGALAEYVDSSLGHSRPIDTDAIRLAVGIHDPGPRSRSIDLEPDMTLVKCLGPTLLFAMLEV